MSSIASVTPTVCSLFGVKPPRDSGAKPVDSVLEEAAKKLKGGKIEKALIYAPDAIGEGLYRDYKKLFSGVKRMAPLEVEMKSVIPTWTPVCFSSMFTGAQPEVHGITKYEKPVLSVDTLFDALAREKKRVAIVAVKGSSIDLVFRNRKIELLHGGVRPAGRGAGPRHPEGEGLRPHTRLPPGVRRPHARLDAEGP